MEHIANAESAAQIVALFHEQNKRIVLVGGCFDLLHLGHITFLDEAKKHGDVLIVLLESDQTITQAKGPKRPINSQNDRAQIIAALRSVDAVIKLPSQMTDKAYDALVFEIKPAIIATTGGDMNRHHKERQAQAVNAQVVDVTPHISDKSTTKLVNLLEEL